MTREKRATLVVFALICSSTCLFFQTRAASPPPQQYKISCELSHISGEKRVVDAQPVLVVESGVAGSFFAGGEVKGDQTPTGETMPFGIIFDAKVTPQSPTEVALSAKLEVSHLVEPGASGYVVDGRTTRIAKRIKLGQPLKVTSADGVALIVTIENHVPGLPATRP